MNIDGKVIIITGAARGIGQEYARHLGGLGALIVAADINDCAATLDIVKAQKGKAVGTKVDVAGMASAADMAKTALDAFGRLDGLINNAALYGSLKGGRFDQIAERDWDAAMAVNVKGIWNCCKAAVPAIRAAGGGSIVNIASLAATYGAPHFLHYTTSKAAVIGMTRGLARELGRDRIRVNAVAPSAVLTEGTSEFFGERMQRALETIKAGQAIASNLEPSDLVGTIVWLLSDVEPLRHRADHIGGRRHGDELIAGRGARRSICNSPASGRWSPAPARASASRSPARSRTRAVTSTSPPAAPTALAQARDALRRTAPGVDVRVHASIWRASPIRSAWRRRVASVDILVNNAGLEPGRPSRRYDRRGVA